MSRMSACVLSDAAVLEAIEDFRDRGREAFLEHHGMKRAESYFICYEGGCYDLKAIARVALGKPQGSIGNSSKVEKEITRLGVEGLRVVRRPSK